MPTHDPTPIEDEREGRAAELQAGQPEVDRPGDVPEGGGGTSPTGAPGASGDQAGGGGSGGGNGAGRPVEGQPGGQAGPVSGIVDQFGRDLSRVPAQFRAHVFQPGQSGNPAGMPPKKHLVKLVEREAGRMIRRKYERDLAEHPKRVAEALQNGTTPPPPPKAPTRNESDLLIARAWLEMILVDKNMAALSQYLDRHPDYGPVVQKVDQRNVTISTRLEQLWDQMRVEEAEVSGVSPITGAAVAQQQQQQPAAGSDGLSPPPAPAAPLPAFGRTQAEERALERELEGHAAAASGAGAGRPQSAVPPEVPERDQPGRPARPNLRTEDIVESDDEQDPPDGGQAMERA